MPTKPKQQHAVQEADLTKAVLEAFKDWCKLNRRQGDEAAIREFTADMDGAFGGRSSVQIAAMIRAASP